MINLKKISKDTKVARDHCLRICSRNAKCSFHFIDICCVCWYFNLVLNAMTKTKDICYSLTMPKQNYFHKNPKNDTCLLWNCEDHHFGELVYRKSQAESASGDCSNHSEMLCFSCTKLRKWSEKISMQSHAFLISLQ